jgi:hypothetical protein
LGIIFYGPERGRVMDPLSEFLPGGLFLFVRVVEIVPQAPAFPPDEAEVFVIMPVGGVCIQPGGYSCILFRARFSQQVFYQQVIMDARRAPGVTM